MQCVISRVMMDLLPIHLATNVCQCVTCSNPAASLALVISTLPNRMDTCVHAMQDMLEKTAQVTPKNLRFTYSLVIKIYDPDIANETDIQYLLPTCRSSSFYRSVQHEHVEF